MTGLSGLVKVLGTMKTPRPEPSPRIRPILLVVSTLVEPLPGPCLRVPHPISTSFPILPGDIFLLHSPPPS